MGSGGIDVLAGRMKIGNQMWTMDNIGSIYLVITALPELFA